MICTEAPVPARLHQAGFTIVELIVVMVLAGILAAYAIPKVSGAIGARDDAWHDSLQGALRFAQKGAVARRRLTCVTITATTVSITSAAVNPATSCSTSVNGPNGSATFASSTNSSAGTSVSPAGTIYFQPDGRVTTDGAGTTSADRTITMSGASSITVYGETGYVE
ncbi:MAG: prepilin-type N-terminal cleavage/methylation domain-containing protein [Aquabacterium sp.]|nr:prepilin-type N-terminal cleavage/methylation domain-containing protein [Aquabacterium sp.]